MNTSNNTTIPVRARLTYLKQLIHYKIWIGIHALPPFIARKWQLHYFRVLAHAAYSHTSFHKRRWDAAGFHPRELKHFENIGAVPTSNKSMLRSENPSNVIIGGFPERWISWNSTSGSTGEPFQFPMSRRLELWNKFSRFSKNGDVSISRFLHWQGIPFKTVSRTYRIAELRVNNRPRGGTYLHLPIADLREDPTGLIERLYRFSPHILDGRSTALVELARHIEETFPGPRPAIPYVVAHGEGLSQTQRSFINRVFGVPVYCRYGLEEFGDLGIECNEHRGFHIHEESFVVEVLDASDRPVPAGTWGGIFATNLFSTVMPFIRYDTGDRGMIIPGRCPCRLSARRLLVSGRRQARFFMIGGRQFNTGEFEVIFSHYHDLILRSQIAKTGENAIELRIVPVPDYHPEKLRSLRNELRDKLSIEPSLVTVNSLDFSPSGKTPFFIDETILKNA